jgi:RNA polymerase sigma-70 factor (ECF subfamily)
LISIDYLDVSEIQTIPATATQDSLYEDAARTYGPALERLARAYEADPEIRRDLLQDMHVGLWRSFAGFDGRCSLRTWIYRVAHNVAASHVAHQRRSSSQVLLDLEELESLPDTGKQTAADRTQDLDRLMALIQLLKPLDRHVILSYLEGLDAASIGEITGLSAGNVATKIHRIKNLLARQFQQRGEAND